MTLRERFFGAAACVLPATVAVLPGVAKIAGIDVAFTMYAASVEFRLELVGRNASGDEWQIAPSALAARVSPSAAPFFAGADHFRRTYGPIPLRSRLREVGRLACAAETPRAASVDITLFERQHGESRTTHERVACGT